MRSEVDRIRVVICSTLFYLRKFNGYTPVAELLDLTKPVPEAAMPRFETVRVQNSMRKPRSSLRGSRLTMAPLLVLASLAGCIALSPDSMEASKLLENPENPRLSAFRIAVATAPTGQTTYLPEAAEGGQIAFVVERPYNAASGQLCREFQVLTEAGYLGFTRGLACKDLSGGWRLSEFIVNPDNLKSP